jgi:acyl carrier protein
LTAWWEAAMNEENDRTGELFRRVRRFLAEVLHIPEAEITLDTVLVDNFTDSLEKAEFVMALEEHFQVELTDHDAAQLSAGTLRTVRDLVRLLSQRRH